MFDAMAIQELMARYLRGKREEENHPFKDYPEYLRKSGMQTMPKYKGSESYGGGTGGMTSYRHQGMPKQTTVPLRPEDVNFEEMKIFNKTVY